MTDLQKLGNKGEKFTVRYLKKHGYKILLRNFKNHFGEIDIIAHNKKYLVFVEVKTRREDSLLLPRFSVDRKKKNRIINTSEYFMRKYKNNYKRRYDISEVFVDNKGKMRINYIENAFIKEDIDIYKS